MQVLRDIALMSTDVLQVAVVLYELLKCAKFQGVTLRQLLNRNGHFSLKCSAIAFVLMLLYVIIFPSS
jgi:hypothetical protein